MAGSRVFHRNQFRRLCIEFHSASNDGRITQSQQLHGYDLQTSPAGLKPGNSLSSLNGSTSPVTAGIYTYTSASTLTLLPDFYYFIVLTGGTIPVRGDYEWSYAGANSYNPSGGWSSTGFWVSNNQLSWSGTTTGNFQFAIDVTAVPEPGGLSLFGLGGLGFLWYRRKAKALK